MYIWDKDNHSVGIEELDNEHKIIFSIINEIYDCIITNDKKLLDKLLLKIVVYSNTHFRTEKKYLLEYSKNSTQEIKDTIKDHIEDHDNFLDVVVGKIDEYVFYDKPILVDIAISLNSWVNNHVMYDDVVIFKLLKAH